MENIFDIIKELNEIKFNSSVPMPPVPDTVEYNQKEIDQIEEVIQKIESISKEISEKEPIVKESKRMRYLWLFLIPGIVAVAIVLVSIFKGNSCIGEADCSICWCNLVSFFIILLAIVSFAIFCYQWENTVEKKYEKFCDQEFKERNDYLKKQSDIFEFRLSICRHQLRQLEFKEQLQKLQLDEYARDKEHIRKIDLKEQERVASLPDKIIELGKIKKTVEKEENRGDDGLMRVKSTETSLLADK